jgi:DNA repair photolyase
MTTREIPARTLINPTGGFLKEGFTHSINIYRGCALGNSLCGTFCYARWNSHHTEGRKWGSFLDVKTGIREAYRRDYDRIKRPRRGEPRPLRIYMSSVTEPYPPQERAARRTRALLEEMIERPPDLLVIQSHTPLAIDDLPLLLALQGGGAKLRVNITVETDMDNLPPGFPRHMYAPRERLAALARLREAGVSAVGVVSPLFPVCDVRGFARDLDRSCNRVILDHYLIGDGSPGGLRTRRSGFPELLAAAGYDDWNRLERLHEVAEVFRDVLGPERVGLSQEGFNRV